MRTVSDAAWGIIALVTVVVVSIAAWELGKTLGVKLVAYRKQLLRAA